MIVLDEQGRRVARIDENGVAHGAGTRVTVTVTVYRDDEITDHDLPACPNAFCPECFFPQLRQPTEVTGHAH